MSASFVPIARSKVTFRFLPAFNPPSLLFLLLVGQHLRTVLDADKRGAGMGCFIVLSPLLTLLFGATAGPLERLGLGVVGCRFFSFQFDRLTAG